MSLEDIFFELLRAGLWGMTPVIQRLSNTEWLEVMRMAREQAVIGVVVDGIELLPKESLPERVLLLKYIGLRSRIKARNEILNRQSSQLLQTLRRAGFKACIIKGQGNAAMYRKDMSRIPGDIDCWVDGRRTHIYQYVRSLFPKAINQYHHIDFPIFENTEVEIHYTPTLMMNFWYNHRLQKYINSEKPRQFAHTITTSDGFVLNTLTDDFNLVFQMSHVMKHYLLEGIGLRQAIDYYYLLLHSSKENRDVATKMLKPLNMYKFARGWMWLLLYVFRIDRAYLLVEPDEEAGKMIFAGMMQGGNFGHGKNGKHIFSNKRANVLANQVLRSVTMARNYPVESLSRPLFILWHQIWKHWFSYRNTLK